MINVQKFYEELLGNGVTNFSGVPDSLLKDFCSYVTDTVSPSEHTITSNEGSAIALATGQYLASGRPSLVYMQNSGFGNALNPLLSLADPDVYGIPMVLLVGWRGEVGVGDEPQHVKQGRVMEPLLDACEIPYFILDRHETNLKAFVQTACETAEAQHCPVVILVRKNTFTPYQLKNIRNQTGLFDRETAICEIINHLGADSVFVSTTGFASRELFEVRERLNHTHSNDLLTVGSMGHASMIAIGIAQNSNKPVVCLDGDGAALMHLGNMSGVVQSGAKNLLHIVLNNAAHDSVGGQPTSGVDIEFEKLAQAIGYQTTQTCDELSDISRCLDAIAVEDGPHFIEIKVRRGARPDLGRPSTQPYENKIALMNTLGFEF